MKALKSPWLYTLALILGLTFLAMLQSSFKSADVDFDKPVTHTVVIQGMKFDPETIQVKKGDLVEWVNKDIVPHDVTALDKAWTSGPLNPGQKWSKTITESFDYFCSIHVVMKANVEMKDKKQ